MRTVSRRLPGALLLVLASVWFASSTSAQVKINEIRIDNYGTDTDEYFELKGAPGASLAGLTYIVIGYRSGGGCGVIQSVTPLGSFSIQADSLLCLLRSGDVPLLTGYDGTATMNFEDGDNVTHMLVSGFTGASGADLDTNDDGTLDVTPWTAALDCVGLRAGDCCGCRWGPGNGHLYCSIVVDPLPSYPLGMPTEPGHFYRCWDTEIWEIGAFSPVGRTDTPGSSNRTCHDADGPGDCARSHEDFGDAPEGFDAYPGIIGRFPTCLSPGPAGTRTTCGTPLSTEPGPAGYVRHVQGPGGYWLGCSPASPDLDFGIDSELDAKSSHLGSACSPGWPGDCNEGMLDHGQDECYGGSDAGIESFPSPIACDVAAFSFNAYNCGPAREVYLNLLIDYNQDGDWNDAVDCGYGFVCAYEWALKNVPILLPSGCSTLSTPAFTAGPAGLTVWMRMTLSDAAVPDDFPWRGSVGLPDGSLSGGETEDYQVRFEDIAPVCQPHRDSGDAPEGIVAYSSLVEGRFPSCAVATPAGTREVAAGCTPVGSVPGPTGNLAHLAPLGASMPMWLGCLGYLAVDNEYSSKVNDSGGAGSPSACNEYVTTDCAESAFGILFGQDECSESEEAGIAGPVEMFACSEFALPFTAGACMGAATAFLNVLVDWNEDGDWNDVLACPVTGCAPEWAVRNYEFVLESECATLTAPSFHVGPAAGEAWMRVTLTDDPVSSDFPWNGSGSASQQTFDNGETEDYPIHILDLTAVAPPAPGGRLWLGPPVPNPARGATRLTFNLPRDADIDCAVFSITGQRLLTLARGHRPAGEYSETWNGRDKQGVPVAAGVYLARVRVQGQVVTTRIILLTGSP